MKILVAIIMAMVMFAASRAAAAGLQPIDIPADGSGPSLTGAVWYPCATAPSEISFDLVSVTVAKDCPVSGDHLPLVVISHGLFGSFLGHYDTAEALADAGFIVAAINHPLDSSQSKSRRPGDIASMIDRPKDIKRLIDYMLATWPEASRIDPDRIGAFGFSRGGYTNLTAIGGEPDFQLVLTNYPTFPGNRWPEQIREGSALAQPLVHDSRITAAVIADPALGSIFTKAGLKGVSVPILLWGAELGGDGVSLDDTASVDRNLPAKPDYRVVPKAGHFAFHVPCNAAFTKAVVDSGEPEICVDAHGFDRVAFHRQFNVDILRFFRDRLP
jgi:predicted dienelactone hydrolase